MKNKLLLLILAMLTMFNTVASAFTIEYDGKSEEYTGSVYKLVVNGEEVETPLEPIIFNDRALVPVREVFEAMGAVVEYDGVNKQVDVWLDNMNVQVTIDKTTALVNGEVCEIEDGIAPKLIAKAGESAKTMVPVRFISENIGMQVRFEAKTGTIYIDRNGQVIGTLPPTESPEPLLDYTLDSISYKLDDKTTKITITASAPIEKMTIPVLTESGVLYTDVYGAENKLENTTEINLGAVKSVRMGQHEEYARIAVDLATPESYDISLSSSKTKIIIVVTAKETVISGTATPTPTPTKAPSYEGELVVVLDAGHGGTDPGAYAILDGKTYYEKDINLSVTKKVAAILKAKGVATLLTRETDVYPTLTERSDFANEKDAAMFVSIHSNYVDNTAVNGIEVYYSEKNNSDSYNVTSKEIATDVCKALIKETSATDRGVKAENHVVTRTCNMPAILVELGFISNETELKNMLSSSYQDKLAGAIAEGILKNISDIEIPEPEPEETAVDEDTEDTDATDTTEED